MHVHAHLPSRPPADVSRPRVRPPEAYDVRAISGRSDDPRHDEQRPFPRHRPGEQAEAFVVEPPDDTKPRRDEKRLMAPAKEASVLLWSLLSTTTKTASPPDAPARPVLQADDTLAALLAQVVKTA